jgi:hypothetical protein
MRSKARLKLNFNELNLGIFTEKMVHGSWFIEKKAEGRRQKAEGFKVRSRRGFLAIRTADKVARKPRYNRLPYRSQKFLLATYYLLLATFPTPLTPNP